MVYSKIQPADSADFNALSEEQINTTLIGKFSDYLKKCVPTINKFNSSKMYLSAMYRLIIEKFPLKKSHLETHYQNTRKELKNSYVGDLKDGEQLQDHAVVGTVSDYIYCSKKFFRDNCGESMYLRGLIVLDFQGIGRISEVNPAFF